MEKFINPFTDFGFKRLFGTEDNKECLLHFINHLLAQEEGKITSITYVRNERVGNNRDSRSAFFDILCTNERGDRFIVELQNTKQIYFVDRTIYYTSFLIQEQGSKGKWDFKLNKIYIISILNFTIEHLNLKKNDYLHTVQLCKMEDKTLFYNKLKFIYLEMPKFTKSENELIDDFEKWMSFIKNLSRLEKIPKKYSDAIFEKMFAAAEIAKLNDMELKEYIASLGATNDYNNGLECARIEGQEEGMAKGKKLGRLEGMTKGMAKGKKLGRLEGMAKGMAKGLAKGLAKGKELGRLEGMAKGKEEGKLDGKLEIAKDLLKMNKSIEEILLITKLSEESIRGLIN